MELLLDMKAYWKLSSTTEECNHDVFICFQELCDQLSDSPVSFNMIHSHSMMYLSSKLLYDEP